jgi:CubicO group peptidase (beta-lactamase class C family)
MIATLLAWALAAPPAPDGLEDLWNRVESVARDAGVHGGIAVVAVRGSTPQVLAFGTAGDAPMTTHTVLRVGSISKAVTSLLALRLVETGVVELDATMSTWLPEIEVSSGCDAPIRLAHLLEHTAGLAGSSYRDYATSVASRSPTAHALDRSPVELRWCPGDFFSYANDGHTIAAAMMERATGEDFDALAAAQVFTPLGLESATYADSGALSQSFDGARQVEPWHMPFRPSGSLAMDGEDLARLLAMFVARGRVGDDVFLAEGSLRRMERGETSLASRSGLGAGSYGLGSFAFVAAGRLFRGHWGKTEGFVAQLGYLPDDGVGFAFVINTADAATASVIGEALAAFVARDLPLRPAIAASDDVLDADGLYLEHTHDMPLRSWIFAVISATSIQREPGGVRVSSAFGVGGARSLAAVTSKTFVEPGLGLPTAAFVEHDGEVYWVEQDAWRRVGWVSGVAWLAAIVVGLAVAIACTVWGACRGLATTVRVVLRRPRPRTRAVARALVVAGACATATLAAFVGVGLLGGPAHSAALGRVSAISVGLAATSIGFAIATVAAAVATFRARQERRDWRYWLGCGATISLAALACIWIVEGWIPLCTWRW